MDFAIVESHEQFTAATRDPKKIIRKVIPLADTQTGRILHVIYFDLEEDVTNDELGLYSANHFTASAISMDERYLSLKNNEQREAFLLDKFGINSEQAKKIITLAKMIGDGTLPPKTTVAL